MNKSILTARNLAIGYKEKHGYRRVLTDVSLDAYSEQIVCLIGANGTGKSTLIRTLSGLQEPIDGDIAIQGKNINKYPAKELAKKLSLVLTEKTQTGNLTVEELTALGRFPYTNWQGTLSLEDQEIVSQALQKTGMETLAHRKVMTLSDGEAQKAMIARALAQNTPLMMLDEPTVHLDLPNRVAVISLLKKLSIETGKAFIISLHEMEIALQVADKLWLIDHQGNLHKGIPEDLALQGLLNDNFTNEHVDFDHETGTFRMKREYHTTINLYGQSHAACWTERALTRKGFYVTTNDKTAHISITVREDSLSWQIEKEGHSIEATNIAEVLESLLNGRIED